MARSDVLPPAPNPLPLAAVAGAATLLGGLGVLPRWPGLPHIVGLPPIDLFTDLRMLFVHAPSYPLFVLGLVVSLALRIAVLAFVLGGDLRERLGFAARFYLVALVPTAIAAALAFTSPATLFYLLFWLGAGVLIVVMIVFAPLPFARTDRITGAFRGAARRWMRAGTVLAYLGLVSLVGALADLLGAAGSVLSVPVSAGLTFLAMRVLADPSLLVWPRRLVAGGTAAGIVALLAVVMSAAAGPAQAESPLAVRPGSLLLMSGVDSSSGSGAVLEIDPATLGFTCEQTYYYSYAGPGGGQPQRDAWCPIRTGTPYVPRDTLRSRAEQVEFLERQLEGLPQPVVLLTHSQGVWHTWAALTERGAMGIGAVVLIGAFPTNPVVYQPDRSRGPGRVGADLVRLVSEGPRPGGTTTFEFDSPLGVEWLAHPDAVENTLARPLPSGVRALSVTSVFDHPLMPDGWRIAGATDACPVPVPHPNLPYATELAEAVNALLDGRSQPACPAWRSVIGPLFRPFGAPPTGA
jgi:hypothetical protein